MMGRSGVGRYLWRQAGGMALVLVAVSLLTFLLVLIAPGDAATNVARGRAGPGATDEQVDRIRAELGLDEAIPVQYGRWLGEAVQGDFGVSPRTGRPIGTEIVARLPTTLFLGAGAAVIAVLVGGAAGLAGALLRPGLPRGALRVGGLLGASVPNFWLSYLLILVLAENLGLLPTSGQAGPASWVMPWVVLALPLAGILSRVVAITVREALDQPYAVAARARGSRPATIVVRDALPNAAGAILNASSGQVAHLLVGSLIVETIFGWPGLGNYFVQAVDFRDIAAIQACVLIFAVAFVVANRLVDLTHGLIDPRVRADAIA